MNTRFDCVLDPFDRFQIWDHQRCLPVIHRGRLLSYATRRRAERVTALLNRAAGRCRHSYIFRQPMHGDGRLFAVEDAEWRCRDSVDTE